LLSSNKSYEVLIRNVNKKLEKLSTWFISNRLSLNTKKTNYILFGKRIAQISEKITLNNEELTKVFETKFLGIYIDSKLNWKRHILETSNAIARNLVIINKLRNKVSMNTLLIMYKIIIQPHLYYCAIIWGYAYSTNLLLLQGLQKRALRLICISSYRSPSNPFLQNLTFFKFMIYIVCS